MTHIHELIDFVVSALIVRDDRVLLVDHKKLGQWLPLGGHMMSKCKIQKSKCTISAFRFAENFEF